jgi:hypothetical protein
MPRNHNIRVIECYICGCSVYTTAARSMCPDCQEDRKRELNKIKNYKNRSHKLKAGFYMVEYDPDTDYGFSKGAEFSRIEILNMLKKGCFTPFTRLKNMRGKIFIIINSIGKNQKLISI